MTSETKECDSRWPCDEDYSGSLIDRTKTKRRATSAMICPNKAICLLLGSSRKSSLISSVADAAAGDTEARLLLIIRDVFVVTPFYNSVEALLLVEHADNTVDIALQEN